MPSSASTPLPTRPSPGGACRVSPTGWSTVGELIHTRGLGTLRLGEDALPDAASVFRIASMTKSFTAATVLLLRDEGRLRLDDPIAEHVPELASLRYPTTDSPPITIRHLLTMTSGLPTDDPWGDRQQDLDLGEFSRLLAGGLSFVWAPGTRFEYSNTGYGILGRLVTNVAGAEYRDVVRERLLAPLGMASTGYLAAEVPPERLADGYVWREGGFLETADGRLRGARVDGRPLHLRRGPRALGERLPRCRPASRRAGWRAPAVEGDTARDAAADGPRGPPAPRARLGRRDRRGRELALRLRAVPARRRPLRPGRGPRRWLPRLRFEHALAPGVRPGHRRARQCPVCARRASCAGDARRSSSARTWCRFGGREPARQHCAHVPR